MKAEHSHYIEYFTHRDRWGQQKSACGEYVDPKRHSNEPTCPDCVAYVTRRTAVEQQIDATFAGPSDPAREVRHVDFDPTTGQQYVSNRRDPRR